MTGRRPTNRAVTNYEESFMSRIIGVSWAMVLAAGLIAADLAATASAPPKASEADVDPTHRRWNVSTGICCLGCIEPCVDGTPSRRGIPMTLRANLAWLFWREVKDPALIVILWCIYG